MGVDLRNSRMLSEDARNAGRPVSDFNDSISSGLEGVLDILRRAEINSSLNGTSAGDGRAEVQA